ncbi:hypothetical protein CYMTET_8245 [Cymbomonas tetramitiformis]|uniref:EGF-like domain-containing protein n=1 Tax=Cymbomonas tetramitiformis TaxID=36881 RepID=A0AAE0LG69_9CHLO|nr:hypothetical protein CYMTET_8245 [Cymbomonas tetramitiformis]
MSSWPPAPPACSASTCFEGSVCRPSTVTSRGYQCSPCPAGLHGDSYRLDGCTDVDECASTGGAPVCDPLANCTNLPDGAGYSCSPCPFGFLGDGYTGCVDVDECAYRNGGCDFLVECHNKPGAPPSCGACPKGYQGSGYTSCEDIDECATDNGRCHTLAACINFGGGSSCGACEPRELYKGDGYTCHRSESCDDGFNGGCDPLTNCTAAAPPPPCSPSPFRPSEAVPPIEPYGPAPPNAPLRITCGPCPLGYGGDGDSGCHDVDGCSAEPCFADVACTDVAAPGVGAICGDCPEGFTGDGRSCEVDRCLADPPPCSAAPPVSCVTTPGGGYACGECPKGYMDAKGDGSTCIVADTCATGNGGCDPLVACTNTLGAEAACGPCPAGYRGSGHTRCLNVSSCSEDNGGCDELTECTRDPATRELTCGPCPEGYTGDGLRGCVDEDGCAAEPCYSGPEGSVLCTDVRAPGVDNEGNEGFVCGPCPVGMSGDGRACSVNRCFAGNGGCDLRVSCTNDATTPEGRRCGACPPELADTLLDGTVCEEEDGCTAAPCFAGVACIDNPAPDTGRACGDCPPGYVGDGEVCQDVDECLHEGGGECWAAAPYETACINLPGSFKCSACPAGFRGTGEAGCVPATDCAVENGGCWVGGPGSASRAHCEDTAIGSVCGTCPAGYEGSGAAACVDVDGCAGSPCFPGVTCTDVPAPELGYSCTGGCPDGYRGDGYSCTPCKMLVAIQSSSVVDGKIQLINRNQGARVMFMGEYMGLDDPVACVSTQGTSFEWSGAGSDGTVLELDTMRHKANTLRLSVFMSDLRSDVAYTLRLTARMTGNAAVSAYSEYQVYVEVTSLVAVIHGGHVDTGEMDAIALDASWSYDPDGEPGELLYAWGCERSADPISGPQVCRQSDSSLLPQRMYNSTLKLQLQGSNEGVNYTFYVTVSKGSRSSTAQTSLRISTGFMPVPTIYPILGRVNPGDALTLNSTIWTLEPEWVTYTWKVVTDEVEGSLDLDLDTALDTPSTVLIIVVSANMLSPGGQYTFQLAAQDPHGVGMVRVTVAVNVPPSGGLLQAHTRTGVARTGVALDTWFLLYATNWWDLDLPLWYQFQYQVTGRDVDPAASALCESAPLPAPATLETLIPEPGLLSTGRHVTLLVSVQDALGAATVAKLNLTVRSVLDGALTPGPGVDGEAEEDTIGADAGAEEGTLEEQEEAATLGFVAALDQAAADAADNGAVELSMVMVDGSASLLNEGAVAGASRRRRLSQVRGASKHAEAEGGAASTPSLSRSELRRSLMALAQRGQEVMFPSEGTTAWTAATVARIVRMPEETGWDVATSALEVYDNMLGEAPEGDVEKAMLTERAAGSITAGLSALQWTNASSNSTDANMAAAVRDRMDAMAAVLLQDAAAGQGAVELEAAGLEMVVQRDDGGRADSRLHTTAMATPGGTMLAVPAAALSSQLPQPQRATGVPVKLSGAWAVDTQLLVMEADPHGGNPAPRAALTSGVTTATLRTAAGVEINTTELAEALTLTLPLQATPAHDGVLKGRMGCTFWDADQRAYSTVGCTTLPNPAPRLAGLYWRTRNVTSLRWGLLEAWAVGNASLMTGCVEMWDGLDPKYGGADRGLRKYLAAPSEGWGSGAGAGCPLATVGNLWGCWWNWTHQMFSGAGCEWAAEVDCYCTHLTDFKAVQETEVGSAEPPRIRTAQLDRQIFTSEEDLGQLQMLFGVVAALMATTAYLAGSSFVMQNRSRERLLQALVTSRGTTRFSFHQLEGMWTWSLFGEKSMSGYSTVSMTKWKSGIRQLTFEQPALKPESSRLIHLDASFRRAESTCTVGHDPFLNSAPSFRSSEVQVSDSLPTGDPGSLPNPPHGFPHDLQRSDQAIQPRALPDAENVETHLPWRAQSLAASNSGHTPSSVFMESRHRNSVRLAPPLSLRQIHSLAHGEIPVHNAISKQLLQERHQVPATSIAAYSAARARFLGSRSHPKSQRKPSSKTDGGFATGGDTWQHESAHAQLVSQPADQPHPASAGDTAGDLLVCTRGSLEGGPLQPPLLSSSGSPVVESAGEDCVGKEGAELGGVMIGAGGGDVRSTPLSMQPTVGQPWVVDGGGNGRDGEPSVAVEPGGNFSAASAAAAPTSVAEALFETPSRPGPVMESHFSVQGIGALLATEGSPPSSSFSHSHVAAAAEEGTVHLFALAHQASLILTQDSALASRAAAYSEMMTAEGSHFPEDESTALSDARPPSGMGSPSEEAVQGLRKKREKVVAQLLTGISWISTRSMKMDARDVISSSSRRRLVTRPGVLSMAFERRRRLLIRLWCIGVLTKLLFKIQDRQGSHTLCELLKLDYFFLQLSLPVQELLKDRGKAQARISAQASQKRLKAIACAREALPVDRLLGTTMVTAYLLLQRIVNPSQVSQQVALMAEHQWEGLRRPILWYISAFCTLIHSAQQGAYKHCQLCKLAFMQHADGCFDLTDSLATVLAAGSTKELLEHDPLGVLAPRVLQASVPPVLHYLCGDDHALAAKVWATLCVTSFCDDLDFEWVDNPESPGDEKTGIVHHAQLWLDEQMDAHPLLAAECHAVRHEAVRWVEKWQQEHLESIAGLRSKIGNDKSVDDNPAGSTRSSPLALLRKVYDGVKYIALSHPIIRIAAMSHLARYSRAQRVLVHGTLFIIMFVCCHWFSYSKAYTCCQRLYEHLGCGSDPFGECRGHTRCIEVMRSDEVQCDDGFSCAQGFRCDAFPQDSLLGRAWTIAIVVGIVKLTQFGLEALFRTSGLVHVPQHIVPRSAWSLDHWQHIWMRGGGEAPLKSRRGTARRTRFLTVHASRAQGIQYLRRVWMAAVVVLTADAMRLMRLVAHYMLLALDTAFGWATARAHTLRRRAKQAGRAFHFLWQTALLRRDPIVVLTELEIELELELEREQAKMAKALQFQQTGTEVDSNMLLAGYTIVFATWAICILMTIKYALELQSLMGGIKQNQIIQEWIAGVIVNNFLLEVVRSVTIRYILEVCIYEMHKLSDAKEYVDRWYAKYYLQNFKYVYHDLE